MPSVQHCLNCGHTDIQVPLVNLLYRGEAAWICPQCLPLLIHHPERLAGKLAGADQFVPFDADEP